MATHESLELYRKCENREITAVQVRLDTAGFSYQKWGATQVCKENDWLVDNQGDIYTVDQETFAKTYVQISPGRYLKTTNTWALRARSAGVIATKEGEAKLTTQPATGSCTTTRIAATAMRLPRSASKHSTSASRKTEYLRRNPLHLMRKAKEALAAFLDTPVNGLCGLAGKGR